MTKVPHVDGTMIEVQVGDWVGFKCDIEQYGKIVKIVGNDLFLENPNGFDGEYIGGQTEYVEQAERCWSDKAPSAGRDDFSRAYNVAREAGDSRCAALRYVAKKWEGRRTDFIAAAEKYGINKATASTQWQKGRK